MLRCDVRASGHAMEAQGPLIDVLFHPHPDAPHLPGRSTSERTAMLVDTGAACTMVDERTARALGLKAIRLSLIGGATGVPEPRPVYLTRMVIRLTDAAGIPHDIAFRQEVVGLEPRPQRLASFGLLGRDCLAGMRFVYDGPSGAFALLRDGEPES